MKPIPVLVSLLTWVLIPSWAPAQTPPHGQHGPRGPQPAPQLVVRCQLAADPATAPTEVVLKLDSPGVEADLTQTVELPAPLPPLRLTRYLPRAECEQGFVGDNGTKFNPAIRVSVDGPTQSYQQWLVAHNTERNRLISLIGSWRYMAVADRKERDELFALYHNELAGKPTLVVSREDGTDPRELSGESGKVHALDDPQCRIRVRSFYPHFGMDPATNQPANLSDKRENPAVLLEIEYGGKTQERWVFARFPDFRADKKQTLPIRVTLECPLERRSGTPDFSLVSVGRTGHELWRHQDDKSVAQPIALDQRIEIAGSPYTFHLIEFLWSGRLTEKYVPTEKRTSVAALRIETIDASGKPVVLWLERGRERTVQTAKGPLSVVFGPSRPAPPGENKCPH